MTNDNKTPRPPHPIPSTPLSLPDDLTIQSLSRLTAKTLSPTHPAARLRDLNDRFHAMMHSEGDQTKLLMRQTQTLDAMFHLLVQQGIASDSPIYEVLALSLRSQKLCRDTVHTVNAIDYMHAVSAAISDKCAKHPIPPPPSRIATNELKDRENDR